MKIDADVSGIKARVASGETLTAPAVDSVNTFDLPRTVAPKPAVVTVHNGKPTLSLAPKSGTVISIES